MHGVINAEREYIIPFEYSDCDIYSIRTDTKGHKCFVDAKAGSYGLINDEGHEKIPFEYSSMESNRRKVLICQKGDRYGVFDIDGNNTVPFEYTIYEYDRLCDEHRFGVMISSKHKKLTEDFKLFRTLLQHDSDLKPTENDYTNLIKKWTAFYNIHFTKIKGTVLYG